MADSGNYEKQPPSAPPPYTILYPTGNSQGPAPEYGFHPPPPQQQQQQPYPPNPGYPQQPYPPGYPSQPQPIYNIHTTQPTPAPQQTVIVMGGCPSCRVGVLEDEYTCCGILCAICFFPIGILCCLAMKEKKCTNCNATF